MTYPWDAPIRPKGSRCGMKPSGTCHYEGCPIHHSYSYYLRKYEDCIHRRIS